MRSGQHASGAAGAAWGAVGIAVSCFALAIGFSSLDPLLFKPVGEHIPLVVMVVLTLTFLGFCIVGALIATRSSARGMGWVFIATGLSVAIALAAVAYGETGLPAQRWAEWTAGWVSVGPFALFPLLLTLFPDGRSDTRAARTVTAWNLLTAALLLPSVMFVPYVGDVYDFTNPAEISALSPLLLDGLLGWYLLPFAFVGSALVFAARFRRSTGARRQQLKWLTAAATFVALGAVVQQGTWFLDEVFGVDISGIGLLVLIASLTTVPVASGIAVLRYRLYDIDVIINRTLVYGALTATLTGTYFAVVTALQGLLRPLAGSSDLAVAASTLVVAAAFGPARGRVQALVDRRFYRSKFDAGATLHNFSARLRQQLDLDALTDDLLAVTGDTMQPAHVSLWLRPPAAATDANLGG